MKDYKNLSFSVDDHVGVLTLDRPEVMNALNRELTLEFHEILDELPALFPEIRVLVITGNGNAFAPARICLEWVPLDQKTGEAEVNLLEGAGGYRNWPQVFVIYRNQ